MKTFEAAAMLRSAALVALLLPAVAWADPEKGISPINGQRPPGRSEKLDLSPFLAQLADPDVRVRWYATYELGQMGPDAARAVEPLMKTLEGRAQDEYVRGTAAWALGRIGPRAEAAVPLLTETLDSKLLSVRRNAAEALGAIGPAARPAVERLEKALEDEDAVVRVNAAAALWKINQHPKALPALVEMLRHGKSPGPYHAAAALGEIAKKGAGPIDAKHPPGRSGQLDLTPFSPDTILPVLVEAFRSDDADVRRAAADGLGQIGQPAFGALKSAFTDPSDEVRRLAVESLGSMGAVAIRPLKTALKSDKEPSVRRAAARALGRLGRDAKEAEADLVEAVNDPDEHVRDEAARALRKVRAE